MQSNEPPLGWWVFMAVWIGLGVVSWIFFSRSRDAALKRRVLRWGHIAASILFTGFVVLITGESWFLLVLVPAVALITFLNIRLTKFCGSCGATLYNANWFVRLRFCQRCGKPLT